MRKANFCYEQNRKKESIANQKAKNNNNHYDQKKKEFVPNRNSKNNKAINFANKNFQENKNNSPSNQNNPKGKESANNHGNYTMKFERKEPIKCWECNGPHYASVYPNWKKTISNIHTIQEEMIVGDLALCPELMQPWRIDKQNIKLPWLKQKV